MNWPSEERDPIVEICWQAGDAAYVCGVRGWITKWVIPDIEREFLAGAENRMGDGLYLFKASHRHRTDTTDEHWELDRLDFRPFGATGT